MQVIIYRWLVLQMVRNNGIVITCSTSLLVTYSCIAHGYADVCLHRIRRGDSSVCRIIEHWSARREVRLIIEITRKSVAMSVSHIMISVAR
jgi:hypothetical protein